MTLDQVAKQIEAIREVAKTGDYERAHGMEIELWEPVPKGNPARNVSVVGNASPASPLGGNSRHTGAGATGGRRGVSGKPEPGGSRCPSSSSRPCS